MWPSGWRMGATTTASAISAPSLRRLTCSPAPLPLRGRQAIAGIVGRCLAHHFIALITRAAHEGVVHVLDVFLQIGNDDALGALLHSPQQLAQCGLAGSQVGERD